MLRRLFFAAAVILLTAAALAFRLPDLGNRPFHGDEAVHAFKFRDLWERGVYQYDPNEYHGPTIYYATLPAVAAKGRTSFAGTHEADYRLPIAIAGALMIPALLVLSDGLGKRSVLWAGLLTVLSPAFVFYSRYYIQEVFLVLFTLLFLGCWWRYRKSGRAAWLVACGCSAGLVIATKETAPLTFLAVGVAWLVTVRWLPKTPPRAEAETKVRGPLAKLLLVTVPALVVAYLFLSGFFSHLAGPLGYFQSYTPWLQRAHGTDLHNHPWSYYLSILAWTHRGKGPVWSEALILVLALVSLILAWLRRSSDPETGDIGFVRFVSVYTLVLTLIYSAIPYKTPWLALNFLSGMILLAGYAASTFVGAAQWAPAKVLRVVLLAVPFAQLGWQAYRTSFVYQQDPSNPYVYAQPLTQVADMGARVEELAKFAPQRHNMVIKVISTDTYYWPVPWYLRRFENVGYYTEIPTDPDADIVIASPAFDEEGSPTALTARLPNHLMTGFYSLRPAVLYEMFVRMSVWEPYVMSKPRPKPEIGE